MKLEQAARQALVAFEYMEYDGKCVTALREALAEQAEQEPVAEVRVRALRGNESVPKIDVEWLVRPTPGFLYAAPVRTKDLTDYEIRAFGRQYTTDDYIALCRSVIAADRRKNGIV